MVVAKVAQWANDQGSDADREALKTGDWADRIANCSRIDDDVADMRIGIRISIAQADRVLYKWHEVYPDDDRLAKAIQAARDVVATLISGDIGTAHSVYSAELSAERSEAYSAADAASSAAYSAPDYLAKLDEVINDYHAAVVAEGNEA